VLNVSQKLLTFLTCLCFLLQLCGCIILGVSIWIRVSKDAQQVNACSHTSNTLFAGVDLLIAVGSIIMVLGFLGCCGAVKESRCMLLLFFIGLLLILILQVTGGILGAVYRSQVQYYSIFSLMSSQSFICTPKIIIYFNLQAEKVLDEALMSSVKKLQSSTQESKAFQEKFQKFERENQCCGLLNGPKDWGDNFKNPSGSYKICQCELEKPSQDVCTNFQGRLIYKKPCGEVIVKYIKDHLVIIMGIAFGLAVIEV
ncbi:TSN8 protein, partial [Tyrannus savana]|nr:TSN8 protein [Tyrannus savana]